MSTNHYWAGYCFSLGQTRRLTLSGFGCRVEMRPALRSPLTYKVAQVRPKSPSFLLQAQMFFQFLKKIEMLLTNLIRHDGNDDFKKLCETLVGCTSDKISGNKYSL